MDAMRHKPVPPLLSQVGASVERQMGAYFPEERLNDLERNIRRAAKEFGHQDMQQFMEWLLSASLSRERIEVLARYFTVGETYFFRDKGIFEALEQEVLPRLILSRKDRERRLRIWSAGCSTGEEAYSIAILLDRLVPDLSKWGVTILATDINAACLETARRGIYHDWSFRNTPQWVKDGYFEQKGKNFEVLPRIKKMVTFSYHNLFDDPYPSVANNTSAMDLVSCRNVLMYFSRERSWEVIRRLHQCILEDGWFITGPIEVTAAINSLFKPTGFPRATLYRKVRESGQAEKKAGEAGAVVENERKKRESSGRAKAPAMGREPVVRKIPVKARAPVTPPEEAEPLSDEAVPRLSQAREAADKGRLSDAIELCDKAIEADRLNASLYYLKATVLMETGKLDEAAACLKQAIYVDEDFVLGHFALGYLMHRLEKPREGERYFRAACRLLTNYKEDDILPESGGISAAGLLKIIKGTGEFTGGEAP
jgi:chemotaxis protein methyltransferase CheR